MKITLKDFGPISEITVDTNKYLNVLYGENSVGKSYVIYCLYCLIKSFNSANEEMNTGRIYFRFNSSNEFGEKTVKSIIGSFPKKFTSKNNITSILEQDVRTQLNATFIPALKNSLLNTFSNLSQIANRKDSNSKYSILIAYSDACRILISSDRKGNPSVSEFNIGATYHTQLKNTRTTRYTITKNGKKLIGTANIEEFSDGLESILYGIRSSGIPTELRSANRLYFLPASRSGLYQALNAFTPILAELSQSRFALTSKSIELPNLPEPLSDYFLELSSVDTSRNNKTYEALIKEIERDILHGTVLYNNKTKRISFKPSKTNIDLDLSQSSSMVAEIAPIVLYLKHIINVDDNIYNAGLRLTYNNRNVSIPYYPRRFRTSSEPRKAILFIEEPEAHLHPKVQVQLVDIFSRLAKLGLKVFMTSHSNYMFNKLNNLLISGQIDIKDISVTHLIHTDAGTVCNTNMEVSLEGIDDTNFLTTSELLYEERAEAYNDAD